MDEHCREREVGALDDLFGVKRLEIDGYHASSQRASLDYAAPAGEMPVWGAGALRSECALVEECLEALPGTRVLGCTEYTDTPLGFFRKEGKGRALLLNCAPLDYLRARRTLAGGAGIAMFYGGALDLAGVKPELEIRAASDERLLAGWQVFPFAHGSARYFGLTPDLGATQDTLGDTTAEGGRAAHDVSLRFPLSGHLYEMRSGKYFGEGDSATDGFEAGSVKLYAVMPYKVEGLELEIKGGKASARLKASGSAGEHVLRFDLFEKSGKRLSESGANVVAAGGAAEWKPEVELPAGGKLTCRDVATGVTAEVALR